MSIPHKGEIVNQVI